jgi:small subunit ribosomal protein S8
MMNDPLGDMLTRIRNAQMRGKSTVRTPASKLRAWVLDVLKDEGYIRGYEHATSDAGHPELEISLKYADGQPVIRELKRISTPVAASIPVFVKFHRSATVLGISVVSTPKGVMSDASARAANVGGEVLCRVF